MNKKTNTKSNNERLKKVIDDLKFNNIELIVPGEKDYRLIEATKNEESISLDKFLTA